MRIAMLAGLAVILAGASAAGGGAPPIPAPVAGPVSSAGRGAAADGWIDAVTKPSADVQMSFTRPGRIAEIRVKQGDAVKTGDLLMRLDDEAEAIEVAQLKAQAEDVIRIRAAEAQEAQKREDLKKLEWAFKEGAATQWEVEHARLEVVIGQLSTALAKFTQTQDRGKYDEARVNLDRMRLASPMAGKVEQLVAEVGQTADVQTKLIRIVNTDLLWSDVPVPMPLAVTLKTGQKTAVEFPKYLGGALEGKVIHIAAVGDPAADTLMVRVEIPNPAGRPAGERVRVRFPPPAPAR